MKKLWKTMWAGAIFISCSKQFLAMRLILFFTILGVSQVFADNSYAQNTKLTLNFNDISVEKVLDEIENQSEFYFMFNQKLVDVDKVVDIKVSNVSIKDILSEIFKDTETSFFVVNKQILLMPTNMSPELGYPNLITNKQKTITGTVNDKEGQPLPGVSIQVKGTTTGTVTDANGKFSMEIPETANFLVFSFVGMKTQEIAIGEKTTFDITMEQTDVGIEEVVAIGYGKMRKSDLTGSVATVDASTITLGAITSLSQGLQGNVAGLQVTSPSGAPGKTPFVRIRGANSIQYGNDPLWIIDGFPVDGGGAFINPNDIETMTVLKDASATAIYGSRGANGVILVTTKRGKAGKTNISFESYYGVQKVSKKIDLMNAQEWAPLQTQFWERFRDGNYVSRGFTDEQIAEIGEGTDWQDEIFRTGAIQNYNLSISGGNEKTQFAVSGNYMDQEGIVINSKYTRGTVNINLDHKANDRFKFGTNLTTSYEYNRRIKETAGINNESVIHGALIYAPTSPVRNEDGTYFSQWDNFFGEGHFANIFLQNPVQIAYERASNSNSMNLLGNFFSTYEIIDGLTAKVSIGANISSNRDNLYTPSYFITQRALNGSASISSNQRINWVNENTLTYNKTINDIHSLTALVGITAQESKSETMMAGSSDFFADNTQYYNLGIGSEPSIPSSGYNKWSMLSYLGRLNYNYSNKLLLTVSARYDGSSRFGNNNRFGFFPSGALAWRVNEEGFLKDISWLSNLKLRASIGKTGNQEIPLYQNIQIFSKYPSYVINNQPSTAVGPGALVNNDLKWETTDQYNTGIDIGFFNHKLSFTTDLYYKKTSDLLFPVSVPRQGGYTSVLKNIGSVENKGVEFGIDLNLSSNDFYWEMSGNISFNKNKVLQLAEADRFFGPGVNNLVKHNGGAATIIMEGQPLGVFWGNIFDGIWQTQEEVDAGHMAGNNNAGPGFENYRDIDGNGIFEEGKDETIVGDPNPDFIFGINNSFAYRNFDLSFSVIGVVGNDVLNLNLISLTSQVLQQNTIKDYNPWDGEGTSDRYFVNDRPAGRSGVFPNRVSTQYIEDGSFVRLQNITFGYTVQIQSIKKFRIYLSADNLFTFTNYSGFSPEVSAMGNTSTAMGIDAGVYPAAKTFRFGVKVNF